MEAQYPSPFNEIAVYYPEHAPLSLLYIAPTDDDDFLDRYVTSKLWRMNNLYHIVDKEGNLRKFEMNKAQHAVYGALLEHPRLIILKSRQRGISTFWLLAFFDDALIIPNLSIGLMAQGEQEASTLLQRIKIAWDNLPVEYKELVGASILRDNAREIAFTNGSSIYIRTSFRSATLQRLHISEYGKIARRTPERARETKTGTLQAIAPSNPTIIESTAEGQNDFKNMWEQAKIAELRWSKIGQWGRKDFKPVFLSWLDDEDCVSNVPEEATPAQQEYFTQLELNTGHKVTDLQRNFWLAQYKELGDDIYQEYPATPEEAFTRISEGCYYSALFMKWIVSKKRIQSKLYDENLEVNVAIDLGMDDTFTMIYFQRYRDEWRIIDEYTNHSEALAHYVGHMNATGYKINYVICPHDIQVRELGTGLSRETILRRLGVRKLMVLERMDIMDGIEAVRTTIPNIWIDSRCTYILDCFRNYSKEWDDRTHTWKARHDEWSHGADALRYMVQSGVKRLKQDRQQGPMEQADGLAF
jgi:hypothetical protein